MIEAELPDGRILEFPAGTDPAVVQSTVKKMLGVPAPLPDGSYSDMTPKRQVGAGEALGRGIGSTFAGQGKTLALAAAAPAMLVDAVGNWFRDKPSTAVQDAVFGALVDPAAEAVRTYAVNPNTEQMGGVATAANIAGNLIGMAPSMIAGGAAQAGPRLAAMSPVVQNLVKGAVAAQPSFALPATVNRASDLLDAGVDGGTVAKASAANLAANTLMGALPVSKAGGLLTRAATGAGLNLASGAAARGAEGAILGDQYANLAQDPFGAKEMGTDAGIGAAMAMLIGPRAVRAQAAPVPPRPDVLALPPPDTTNVIRVDPQGVARPELASEGAVADLVADMTGQRRPPPPAALPDRSRVIEGEAVRVPDPELPAPGVQQNRPGATMRVSPEGVARAETPEEQRQRTEQQTQAETVERYRREELGNESPDAPDPRFNDNPPRTEAPNARPDTSGARSAGPGDAAARGGGNDGAVDRQPGAAPRDANARAPENGDQRQPPGGEGPARTDGNSGGDNRNPRVADPRGVPRLQVEHEKVRTQAKKNRTAIGNLEREIASPEFKALPEKKQAAVRDRLAKARTQLKAQEARLSDIAEALTPERMPKREGEGMTLMQALRKKGGVTPEMARDMGIDAKDPKTVNKKGLADENQIEDALDDLGVLRPGEKYADVVQRLERELRGEGERTETDLEREASARERQALEDEAAKYGIDTRDMTRQQVLDALEREQAKGQSQADMDEANSAAEFARQEAMDGRTIDDLLDEVGVTDKDIEDAKYRREAEVESKAAADEAERARAGGDEAAPVPEHSRPAEQARADEVRPQPEPGNEPPGSGSGKGDGADGGQEPVGGTPSRDYPGRAAASRLNALPLDAVWETFKKSLGNSKQWREYVDFLGETTKDFFKRLTDNPKAALKSLVDASKTSSGENAAVSAIRLLNEDLGRRARIIVDKFDSPTARKVLDMMDFEMGRGEGVGTVFREAMQRRLNVSLNGLKPVLEAVAAAEDSLRAGGMGRKDAHAKVWEAVIERVENPGMSRSGHIGAAAKAVEGWYKELLDMQREAGVDIGDRGPAYFTVRYDADKIAANPDAFTRDITEAYKAEGVAADEARARAEALTTAKLRGESVELVGMLSGSASSVTKERQFTKPAVLNSLRKWRVMDGEELMQAYAYGAAQRASIAERFGDNFGGTREEVVRGGKRVREGKVIVKSWKQLTDDITREGGAGALPILRQIVEIGTGINSPRGGGAEYADFFRNAMTMGALEKSVLPNLMEAVTPLATTNGNMAAALNLMRSNLQAVLHGVGILPKSERRAAAQALLEGLGSISDIGARAQAMARYSGMDSGKGVMSKATGKFFEGIGLTRLEDTNRITAADVGGVWFDSMAKSILGDKGWQSLTKGTDARTLRDFGIPAGKERAFAEYVRSLDGGIPTVADLHAAGEMGKLYSTAINRFVHSTVQHSDGLTRPSWASTPWGALVYQFSSYTYTFHKNVIRRAYNNAMAAGNLKNDMGAVDRLALATGMLPGLMVMGAASYASMWARDELLNELAGTKKNLTQQAKNERAVMNANLFGKYGRIFEQFGQQRWGTGSAGLFVPPAVAQAAKAADQVVAGVRDNSPSNTAGRKAVKAVFNTVVEPAWQIALSAGPGLPFGVASVGLRTFAPSAAEGVVTDAVAGPMKSRRETVVKGVFE